MGTEAACVCELTPADRSRGKIEKFQLLRGFDNFGAELRFLGLAPFFLFRFGVEQEDYNCSQLMEY